MRIGKKICFQAIVVITALLFTGCTKSDNQEHDSKNVIVLIKYKAQLTKEADAVSALTALIDSVKLEPHFVNIKLHVDPKDKTNILLYEEWSDESYYNSTHMTTGHLQKFIAESGNFMVGPPDISFWQVEKEFK